MSQEEIRTFKLKSEVRCFVSIFYYFPVRFDSCCSFD